MNSAFYYWNSIDVIPEKFCLATKRINVRYKDTKIKNIGDIKPDIDNGKHIDGLWQNKLM